MKVLATLGGEMLGQELLANRTEDRSQTQPLPLVEVQTSSINSGLPSILFIDDERLLLNAFKRSVSPSALVTVAHGGEEALAILG